MPPFILFFLQLFEAENNIYYVLALPSFIGSLLRYLGRKLFRVNTLKCFGNDSNLEQNKFYLGPCDFGQSKFCCTVQCYFHLGPCAFRKPKPLWYLTFEIFLYLEHSIFSIGLVSNDTFVFYCIWNKASLSGFLWLKAIEIYLNQKQSNEHLFPIWFGVCPMHAPATVK